MISIVIPYHDMENAAFFMKRCIDSIMSQTYTDYEIVLTKAGKMAENTNAAIKRAKGDIIKILFLDDYLAHPNALKNIVDNFKGGWLVTGCEHDDGEQRFNPHLASWHPAMAQGMNTIGSPSVLAFENKNPELFDEGLSWMLDCDLYTRLYKRYGKPSIINDINVVIGVGSHQTTHLLPEEVKAAEVNYVIKKHE